MAYSLMNFVLEKPLHSKGTITLPYPEGKNAGHFFGGINHTLSIDGVFFRSPRDFALFTQQDKIVFTWSGPFSLPVGALLHLQAEMPGGDFYFDPKIGVAITNMVSCPLFMVNLTSPLAENEYYCVPPTPVEERQVLIQANTHLHTPRNIIIYSDSDNSHAAFNVVGEDLYNRPMLEKHVLSADGISVGKKAFSVIHRITSTHSCTGNVWVGTGSALGLPVYLPMPGYLIREIINGEQVTGGTILAAETAFPTATTGDRRGTYTPPPSIVLNGQHSIQLLLSLLAPGNIGLPDYAG